MNGGTIAGLREAPHHDVDDTKFVEQEEAPHWLAEAPLEPEPMPREWIAPTLAMVAVIAWVGGMLVWAGATLGRLQPVELASFVAALCVPPLLIGIVWLLLRQGSRSEARRFTATAQAMRTEALALEQVVSSVRRSIAESRAELTEHTGQLMMLGEGATDRLRGVRAGIAEQVAAINATTSALTQAATHAEHRLGTVLDTLPRAHAETESISQRLEATGLAASERIAALDAALAAVAQRGRDADEVAGGAAQRLAAHIARMEATSESAGTRLETVIATMSGAIDEVLDRAANAIDESRKAITAQGDATIAMIEANGAAIERAGREGADQLAERMGQIDGAIRTLAEQIDGRRRDSEALLETLQAGLGAFDARFAAVEAQGIERAKSVSDAIGERLAERRRDGEALLAMMKEGIAGCDARFEALRVTGIERVQAVAGSIEVLTQVADALNEALDGSDATARRVVKTAEEVLTALDAAAREMDETLPGALDRLDARVSSSREVVARAKPELLALVTAAESTHEAIEAIAGVVDMQRETLSSVQQRLLDTLDVGKDRISEVRDIADETIATTVRFAEDAAPRLSEAMLRIRDTAESASAKARQTLAKVLPDVARDLEAQGTRALANAVDRAVTNQVAELSSIANQAVASAIEAGERLSRQMAKITETGEELETRMAAARAEREAADSEQFSRRVTTLIEAMNSASIDIAKSLSTDVSDTAWAAYLKGDRGVFTRRAVRLVDGAEAREIALLYDGDEGFRDQVNRYIHDFEAMLRQVLSLRDGSSMGVTLLSSDMGKLYVVLAQAIERLRN